MVQGISQPLETIIKLAGRANVESLPVNPSVSKTLYIQVLADLNIFTAQITCILRSGNCQLIDGLAILF